MTTGGCLDCQKIFTGASDKRSRAWELEQAAPKCFCEQQTLGVGSPGPVADNEDLYRFIVAGADIDEQTGELFRAPFESAYSQGLSVFRGSATNDDIELLVKDRLSRKWSAENPTDPLTIKALYVVKCFDVRRLEEAQSRAFCVYDETVKRRIDPNLPDVPTHVSIYQRVMPPPATKDRKISMDVTNSALWALFNKAARVPLESFRGGLLLSLNSRSLAGEFRLLEPPTIS